MNVQMNFWFLTVGHLLLAFIIRYIRIMWKHAGKKHHALELGDENDIYFYDVEDVDENEEL